MGIDMNKNINQLLHWLPNAELSQLPMVAADAQRIGMRHFAACVNIITTRHNDERFGLTATAVCSVTIDPPRLAVLVNKNVAACDAALNSGNLCINVLAESQEHEARVFSGMVEGVHGPARFEHGCWGELTTGAPVLKDALANFDCRIVKVFDESTHYALLCEVVATGEHPGGDPLIYMNGAFRRFAPLV